MMIKTTLMTAITTLLFSFSTGISASGTESYGAASNTVDRLYEKGKASYHAKDGGGQRLRVCVKSGDTLEKVSRKSLKNFEGTSESELTNNLVHCDLPDSAIASTLAGDQVSAMVYYLNKRYRLNLYGS